MLKAFAKKPGILEAAALIAKVQALSVAISRTEDGQEARWQLLQNWIASNPQYRQLIDKCLKQSPAEAFKTVLAELRIEPALIQALDRNGSVTLMATETIETIQQLYRERAGIAQGNRYVGASYAEVSRRAVFRVYKSK